MEKQHSLMREQTKIQRGNGALLTCDPTAGQEEHPSGYTCWGPETGTCRTLHITQVNALKCIENLRKMSDSRKMSHDFQDRMLVPLYYQKEK